jgi:hypothetical protein
MNNTHCSPSTAARQSGILPNRKSAHGVAVAILLSILLVQGLVSARSNGQTVDETFYSAGGYSIVRYNTYEFLGDHPPFISQLAGLPLLFLQPKFPIKDPLYVPNTDRNDVSRNGARFLYEMGNDPQLILFLERLPIIGLMLFLGLCLYAMGRELFGEWGGLLSLFLYAFDPNILAHGSLFTTDLGITAFYFISIYALKRFFDAPSPLRAVILGVSCGLTFMSKISGLMLFPVITLLFLLYCFACPSKESAKPLSEKFDKRMGVLSLFILVNAVGQKQAMVTLGPLCILTVYLCFKNWKAILRSRWTVYLFRGFLAAAFILCLFFSYKLKKKYGMSASILLLAWNVTVLFLWGILVKFQDRVFLVRFTKFFLVIWLMAGLVIILGYTDFIYKFHRFIGFGNFVKPLNIVLTHSLKGHHVCVEGSFITCDWRYFFGIMAIKVPLLSLALSGLGGALLLASPKSAVTKALCLAPLVFYLGASVFNGINIGIRHILPIFPFLFLIAGIPGAAIEAMKPSALKKILIGILWILLAFYAGRTLRTAPDYLAYFNEFVGGTEQGVKLVADSNLNWGQDNKRLADFVLRQKIPLIKIASEAQNADVYGYYKIPWKGLDEKDVLVPSPGFYALGIGFYTSQQKDTRSWFCGRKPDHRVGKTFYVFEVPQKQAVIATEGPHTSP